PDIGRSPGFHRAPGVLDSEVQLGGLLRIDRLERLDAAHRAGAGREQLPVIREALTVAQTYIGSRRQARQAMLVTEEAAVQRVTSGVAGTGVGPVLADRHAHPVLLGGVVAVEHGALVRGLRLIDAQPSDQAAVLAQLAGQLAKYPVLAELGVLDPGGVPVGIDA